MNICLYSKNNMTNEEKINYINESFNIIERGLKTNTYDRALSNEHFSKLPKKLFKYSKINEYTIESLSEGKIYLAPMNEMDDPFECSANLDLAKIYDQNQDSITNEAFEAIVNIAMQYSNPDEREKIRAIIDACKLPNNTMDKAKLLSSLIELNVGVVPQYIVFIINMLANLPEQILSPDNKRNLEKLISLAPSMSKILGIYAMSEDKDNQVLWSMYTDNYRGICIEYDFEHEIELAFHTLPVLYQKDRNNNAIALILEDFINGFIKSFTLGGIDTNRIAYITLLLTKSTDWEFQHEWRIFGDANTKVNAPKINAIYLGNKCCPKNKNKILEIARAKNIPVYKQTVDIENLSFKYEKLL